MKIAVLCPTRSRPEGLKRLCESAALTSTTATVIAYIDEDERDLYGEALAGHVVPGVKVHIGPRMGLVGSLNRLTEIYPDYDIYGLAVDDSHFVVEGWDQWVAETIARFPNRLGVVSASHSAGPFVNFGYVSRQWIDLLGWYACPQTAHFCWDTVLELLGEATRIEYAPADRFHIHHDLHQGDGAIPRFVMDCVQFLGWCSNQRRQLVIKIREAM